MKLDTHVHTMHSGRATVYPFNYFMRESYNMPESVYEMYDLLARPERAARLAPGLAA